MATIAFNFAELSRRAKDAISKEFPNAAVSVDEGWHGRVHMKVVSEAFNGRSEDEKQRMVWDVLRRDLNEDAQGISLVLVYSLDEI